MNDSSLWYAANQQAQFGPMRLDELKNAYHTGKLPRDIHVWQEGMPNWVPAVQAIGGSQSPPPFPHQPAPVALSADLSIKPKRTIIVVGVFGVLGFLSSVMTLSMGQPAGPMGEIYRHIPEMWSLAKVGSFIGLLTSIVLVVAAYLAHTEYRLGPRLLIYSVAGIATLGFAMPLIQMLVFSSAGSAGRVPSDILTPILILTALSTMAGLGMWGFIYWLLTRNGWHRSRDVTKT